jgi:N-carbamoylputrescine amidase
MSRPVTIGLAQITGWPYSPKENRALSLAAAGHLFDQGARIVVLPELISSGYGSDRDRMLAVAETLDGPTAQAWAQLAGRAGGVIVGGICERGGDALYNTAVGVSGEGVLFHYRKLHLFADEKHCFAPGDKGLPIVTTAFGTIAPCICYDLRFVEVARLLALQGAELICVPTAWVPGFDQQRWDEHGFCPQSRGALLQANLDQVYIACASQVGRCADFEFLGSSLVCDPYGKAVLGPLSNSQHSLASVEIDLDAVTKAHDRNALINPRLDRRTDVYGLRVRGTVL